VTVGAAGPPAAVAAGGSWLDRLVPAAPGRHVPPAPGLHDAADGRLPYPVWVGVGGLDALPAVVRAAAPAHRYVLVTDDTVAPLHAPAVGAAFRAAGLEAPLLVGIPAGERHKTRESWAGVTDALLDAECGRDTTVLALGGGVVGDLAGFVAATFMRGVPVVQVPTTLLAMLDASVGGKTGVDTPAGKNLVGAFHPPAAVLCDPATLRTLPRADLVAGAAEALKHGVIADPGYLAETASALAGPGAAGAPERAGGVAVGSPGASGDEERLQRLARLVARSVALKAAVVAHDEREGGVRKVLNFGHTIGHAVEALSGYTLRHGEAVAIGMVVEAAGAERAGVAAPGTADAVRQAVVALGLPVRLPDGMPAEAVLAATRSDKKARAGTVEYALPTRVGAMAESGGRWSVPLGDDLVREVLRAGGAA
jgi:3-dehydroquinate synthase